MIRITFVVAALLAGAVPASADFTISKAPTQNVSCSNGLCVPTAENPILNTGDLQTLLAAGNVEIQSRGNHVRASSIVVKSGFAWSAATTLRFDERLVVDKPVSINGPGSLLTSRIDYGLAGRIQCADLSCNVNGYTPVNTLQGLASAIAANPQGGFALVHPYDASADGTYTSSPIPTNFLGALEGLGNTISNISINNTTACCVAGLFQNLSQAYIHDLRLKNLTVKSTAGAAGLAYESFAVLQNVTVSGVVAGGSTGDVGGVVADNYGQVEDSLSTATVSAGSTVTGVNVGGIVAADYGSVEQSYATGNVSAGDGTGNIGGLAGLAEGGFISDSYAYGAVSGGAGLTVGGLLGLNARVEVREAYIEADYSTGAVSGGSGSVVGGFIGENDNSDTVYSAYWDTTTSGTNAGVGLGNASNIMGLTTEQLQSGLPPGFDPHIWRQSANTNNGFPYLKRNAPPK